MRLLRKQIHMSHLWKIKPPRKLHEITNKIFLIVRVVSWIAIALVYS